MNRLFWCLRAPQRLVQNVKNKSHVHQLVDSQVTPNAKKVVILFSHKLESKLLLSAISGSKLLDRDYEDVKRDLTSHGQGFSLEITGEAVTNSQNDREFARAVGLLSVNNMSNSICQLFFSRLP